MPAYWAPWPLKSHATGGATERTLPATHPGPSTAAPVLGEGGRGVVEGGGPQGRPRRRGARGTGSGRRGPRRPRRPGRRPRAAPRPSPRPAGRARWASAPRRAPGHWVLTPPSAGPRPRRGAPSPSGAAASTTCALIPLIPKLLTPATRGRPSGHGVAASGTDTGRASQSRWGLGGPSGGVRRGRRRGGARGPP